MDYIKLIPRIFAEDAEEAAVYYDHCGADELFYKTGLSEGGQDEDIRMIKRICRTCDLPVNVLAPVSRFEDIKKLIYAGARRVFVEVDSGENLIACRLHSTEEIAEEIGADSLAYLSVEAAHCLTGEINCGFCDGCFTGCYPIRIPEDQGKSRFEQPIPVAGE